MKYFWWIWFICTFAWSGDSAVKPQLLWKAEVGVQSWLNMPIISGDKVFVASSGIHWNSKDKKDGVYCFHLETGKKMWFTALGADANQMAIDKNNLYVVCDDGRLYDLDTKKGTIRWSLHPSPDDAQHWTLAYNAGFYFQKVYGKHPPEIYNAAKSQFKESLGEEKQYFNDEAFLQGWQDAQKGFTFSKDFFKKNLRRIYARPVIVQDQLIVANNQGEIFLVSRNDGKILKVYHASGSIRQPLTWFSSKEQNSLFYATESGYVGCISYPEWTKKWEKKLYYPNEYVEEGRSTSVIYASPLVFQHKVIIAYIRSTYFEYPALAFLKIHNGEVIAHADAKPKQIWGNFRVGPTLAENKLYWGGTYSNCLYIMDIPTQKIKSVVLGHAMFPHWSSPVIRNNEIFLTRTDGYLYCIDKKTSVGKWAMDLSCDQRAGDYYNQVRRIPYYGKWKNCSWELKKGHHLLLATPAVNDQYIVVGNAQGKIFAIKYQSK